MEWENFISGNAGAYIVNKTFKSSCKKILIIKTCVTA